MQTEQDSIHIEANHNRMKKYRDTLTRYYYPICGPILIFIIFGLIVSCLVITFTTTNILFNLLISMVILIIWHSEVFIFLIPDRNFIIFGLPLLTLFILTMICLSLTTNNILLGLLFALLFFIFIHITLFTGTDTPNNQ